jgi:hypothetical protein
MTINPPQVMAVVWDAEKVMVGEMVQEPDAEMVVVDGLYLRE